MSEEYPVVWFQGAGCTGCSVSLLNSASLKFKDILLDEIVPGKKLNLRFHPTVMAGQGEMIINVLRDTKEEKKGEYILIVEGAVPTLNNGIFGAVGEKTILERVLELGKNAFITVAVGNCAAYGGIPAAKPNPTGCKSVKRVFEENGIDTLVVNLPGCPPHPDWMVGTLSVALRGLPLDLDEIGRPRLFYGKTIHENCERRAYFDKGKFAQKFGEEGCLYELGCKGPYTSADCPLREWNNGVNWVIGAGSPCLGCVEPEFPDNTSPFYRKLSWEEMKNEKNCN
ncbi:MAG: hydrogenase small subunit [Caldiserica bacterium]|nr:hydrogenase small subunit [Caldisericota bacterium]